MVGVSHMCAQAQEMVKLVQSKGTDSFYHTVLAFTCHQMLLFEATRQVLVAEPGVLTFLVECWASGEPEVQEAMEAALDALVAADPAQWQEHIRTLKFERYNRDWLAAVRGASASASGSVIPRSAGDGLHDRLMTFLDFKAVRG